MSEANDDLKKTAVSQTDEISIDDLKVEEKEKLAAAEKDYEARQANRQAQSDNGAGSDTFQEPLTSRSTRRRRQKKNMPWIPGVILVGLGVIFLLNNVAGLSIHNWWALFILIPAFGSFGRAAEAIRRAGEFTREAWNGLFGGVLLSLVAGAFLFDLDWGLIWPAFLILGGLGLFLGALKNW